MLIITERKKIGEIFGHPVYQVARTSMVELSNSKSRSSFQDSKDESRYSIKPLMFLIIPYLTRNISID
jgi:phosphatidylinositol 3,5-bisphosphate 5-phosphatase